MDRFRELSAFIAVAEEGAFNAAAKRLRTSPPVVTRLVNALEDRLGARLLTRTTRQVSLTDAGRRFLSDAARVIADLEKAEASASGVHEAPQGTLRVTAPVLFGERHMAPILRDYLDAFPAMKATTLFVDRIVNLIDEGLDVAVRIGELPDSSLTATRVGAVRRVVVASPGYLKDRTLPSSPRDLSSHRIVLPTGASDAPVWEFSSSRGRRSPRLDPALEVNTMRAAIDAAVAGWGVTRVLSYQVSGEIASGTLVELLKEWETRLLPVHLLHPEGRRPAARIRTFVDFAAARLRAGSGLFAAR